MRRLALILQISLAQGRISFHRLFFFLLILHGETCFFYNGEKTYLVYELKQRPFNVKTSFISKQLTNCVPNDDFQNIDLACLTECGAH